MQQDLDLFYNLDEGFIFQQVEKSYKQGHFTKLISQIENLVGSSVSVERQQGFYVACELLALEQKLHKLGSSQLSHLNKIIFLALQKGKPNSIKSTDWNYLVDHFYKSEFFKLYWEGDFRSAYFYAKTKALFESRIHSPISLAEHLPYMNILFRNQFWQELRDHIHKIPLSEQEPEELILLQSQIKDWNRWLPSGEQICKPIIGVSNSYESKEQFVGLEWQSIKCKTFQAKSLNDLDRFLKKYKSIIPAWMRMDALLICWALKGKYNPVVFPALDRLKRQWHEQKNLAPLDRNFIGHIANFETALQKPQSIRWEDFPDFKRSPIENFESEYMLKLCWVRLLQQTKKKKFAEVLALELSSDIRAFTLGFSDDPLGLGASLISPLLLKEQELPSSLAKRSYHSLVMLSKPIRSLGFLRSYQLAQGKISWSDLKPNETSQILQAVFDKLSLLKGPALKIFQTLEASGFLSPGGKKSLPKNHLSVTKFSQVRKIIEEELNSPLKSLFSEFHSKPFAMGSMGQVHKAKTLDGKTVAVKVQYPQIRKVITNDLKLVGLLLALMKDKYPKLNREGLKKELHHELFLEADYNVELKNQIYFKNFFKGHKEIYIPTVYPDLSSEKVLTSEWVQAPTLKEVLKTMTAENKKVAAEAIAVFFTASLQNGKFNSDLNLENFLFDGEKMTFIDFGSVKTWDVSKENPWLDLTISALNNDFELFCKALNSLGVPSDPKSFPYQHLYEVYMKHVMGLLSANKVQVLNKELIFSEIKELIKSDSPILRSIEISYNYFYAFRFYYGMHFLQAQIGHAKNWREFTLELLQKTEPAIVKTGR